MKSKINILLIISSIFIICSKVYPKDKLIAGIGINFGYTEQNLESGAGFHIEGNYKVLEFLFVNSINPASNKSMI